LRRWPELDAHKVFQPRSKGRHEQPKTLRSRAPLTQNAALQVDEYKALDKSPKPGRAPSKL
jgi:hypothetical protein